MNHCCGRRLGLCSCLVLAAWASSLPAVAAQSPVSSAVVPVPQQGMAARHREKVEAARAAGHDLLLIGDSITHNLDLPAYREVWNRFDFCHPTEQGYAIWARALKPLIGE